MTTILTYAADSGSLSLHLQKTGVGFGDPKQSKAHPRPCPTAGAFFAPATGDFVMAVCVGNSSELPCTLDHGSPTPRASSPDFGESRDDVFSTLSKETAMSNTQIAPVTFSLETIRTENGLFSLNDLHKAAGGAGKDKPFNWMANQQTKDLIAEIEKAGNPAIQSKQRLGTFVCKELVCAYAAWISPAFHLLVIRTFLAQHETPKLESDTLSKEQWGYLYNAVQRMCEGKSKFHYRAIYGALKREFGVAECKHIKAADFAAACALLEIPVPDFAPPAIELKPDHIETLEFDKRRDAYYHITVSGGKVYRQRIMYGSDAGDPYSPRNQRH